MILGLRTKSWTVLRGEERGKIHLLAAASQWAELHPLECYVLAVLSCRCTWTGVTSCGAKRAALAEEVGGTRGAPPKVKSACACGKQVGAHERLVTRTMVGTGDMWGGWKCWLSIKDISDNVAPGKLRVSMLTQLQLLLWITSITNSIYWAFTMGQELCYVFWINASQTVVKDQVYCFLSPILL